jgi:hypothetical protein
MSAEIVPIHEGPSLNDIVAQIRAFADRIENGEYGDVEAVIAVMPRERSYPTVFAWGAAHGAFNSIIQLDLAHQWMVRAAVGLEP